ncbi:glucosamine-6-phosphate deaminase [Nesterenkonia natronophila]|uniref:Glucosamine-6-phosphate deaminase n=1 Tax=Nesterenkonia natronophila TaxID=2174932 RepID=A0A3A4F140_9MICC|nr:glucosamine-6-phosphate deaminase [Nesterenkonia natronophila]RJN31793.1 glucosamine-6-phosphate deaminase [Nesterenkonia natronophila]
MTRLFVVTGQEQGGDLAAEEIARALAATESGFVLGVATGSSPESTWRALAARKPPVDLSAVRAFALDEYWDLPADHPESYKEVIHRQITRPLGLNPQLVRVPGDDGKDLRAAQRYEQAIRAAGGIDLQVLGIGRNGHIGFNEPGSSLDSRCRVTQLSEETRKANSRFFATVEDVPAYCITQGIGTITEARRLLLLAYGPEKAQALAAALEGPVTSAVPASALQLHPDLTVVADESAASQLRRTGSYGAAGTS